MDENGRIQVQNIDADKLNEIIEKQRQLLL